jgi:hypothetical protein
MERQRFQHSNKTVIVMNDIEWMLLDSLEMAIHQFSTSIGEALRNFA